MNYIEKVEWLKEAKEAAAEMPFCDEFYIDMVNIEKQVYEYEMKLFKDIVHSVNNNLVVINKLSDMKLDFMDDDTLDYLEVEEMVHFENIKNLCNKAQGLYFKDRIESKYEYFRDNQEETEEVKLSLSVLDNDILDILDYTSDKDAKILKLK